MLDWEPPAPSIGFHWAGRGTKCSRSCVVVRVGKFGRRRFPNDSADRCSIAHRSLLSTPTASTTAPSGAESKVPSRRSKVVTPACAAVDPPLSRRGGDRRREAKEGRSNGQPFPLPSGFWYRGNPQCLPRWLHSAELDQIVTPLESRACPGCFGVPAGLSHNPPASVAVGAICEPLEAYGWDRRPRSILVAMDRFSGKRRSRVSAIRKTA
jgi:hypothetical protein